MPLHLPGLAFAKTIKIKQITVKLRLVKKLGIRIRNLNCLPAQLRFSCISLQMNKQNTTVFTIPLSLK